MSVMRVVSSDVGSRSALLRIEAPSAAAAFVLAGSLGKYRARAVAEAGQWIVVIPPQGAAQGVIHDALSVTRDWLIECDVPATSVTVDGQSHLLRREDIQPVMQ
jgi:hypothetical protein